MKAQQWSLALLVAALLGVFGTAASAQQPTSEGSGSEATPESGAADSGDSEATPESGTAESGAAETDSAAAESAASESAPATGSPFVPRPPTTAPAPPRAPHGAAPHGGGSGEPPPIALAQPSPNVPPGTIMARLVDAAGRPVAGATVRIGVMLAGGSRDAHVAESDSEGRAVFADLPTGAGQAYRVTHAYQGANYGCMPFRLEPDQGHEVILRRLETTEEQRFVLQVVGQTLFEYRDERVHISQQAQLANLGDETYIFPDGGIEVRLPEGFSAFQSQRVMTDQRLTETENGFLLQGSLAPGRVTLVWAYDIPLDGSEFALSQPMPFRTYRYRVLSEASDGMSLSVDGFPPAEAVESQGRRVLLTEILRRPTDAAFERLSATVSGIPSPGPWRWVALIVALAFVVLGLVFAFRGGDLHGAMAEGRARRREELLEDIQDLERQFEDEEIGPQYRARRREEIVTELASLLRLDAASDAATGKSGKA